MAKAKSTTGAKASGVSVKILERLDALREGIQDAYCMAACVDYALLHKESDMDPEIAVCVRKYLVHPLDALSYEAADIKAALHSKPPKAVVDEPAAKVGSDVVAAE